LAYLLVAPAKRTYKS